MNKQLMNIQTELKAPKGQYNSFGKYNYRSCEDIVEAVKPLLAKYEANLVMSDDLILIGDRYYIKATVTFSSKDGDVSATAFAREPQDKKGMDESQITGTASSYARKYALNGLFAIDDNKDADTDEFAHQTGRTSTSKGTSARGANRASKAMTNRELLIRFAKSNGIDLNAVNKKYGLIGADEQRFGEVLNILKQDMSGEEAQ